MDTTEYQTPPQQVAAFRGTATDRAALIMRLVATDQQRGGGCDPDWARVVGLVAYAIAMQEPGWDYDDVCEAADDTTQRGAVGLTTP